MSVFVHKHMFRASKNFLYTTQSYLYKDIKKTVLIMYKIKWSFMFISCENLV